MLSTRNIIKIPCRLIHWAILAGLLFLFFFWQNNSLVISHYTCTDKNIPSAFDGFTIVQISDLHNKSFGA